MNTHSFNYTVAPEVIATLIVIVGALLINFAISAVLRTRTRFSRETKLRASVFWRNFLLLVTLILLVFVWRAEIRAAALSLAALSVALVLAGKDQRNRESRERKCGGADLRAPHEHEEDQRDQ